jgi:ubiquinone/menaquinone biosynthesis C-methylase UbiE
VTVEEHYGRAGFTDSLDAIAPFAEFHTLGPSATSALADLAAITAGDELLDVGCGIAGPLRHLVADYGVRGTGIDLTPEFCDAAIELNRRAGLDIPIHVGSALDLPFEDASFDVVWTQHASMNIEDKARMYVEMRRVLRRGGRLAFFDVVAGPVQPIHYPVPWAEDDSISFLVTIDAMRALIEAAGFEPREWQDRTEAARSMPSGGVDNPLIPNLAEKIANHGRNFAEDRSRLLQAVCVAV